MVDLFQVPKSISNHDLVKHESIFKQRGTRDALRVVARHVSKHEIINTHRK